MVGGHPGACRPGTSGNSLHSCISLHSCYSFHRGGALCVFFHGQAHSLGDGINGMVSWGVLERRVRSFHEKVSLGGGPSGCDHPGACRPGTSGNSLHGGNSLRRGNGFCDWSAAP